MRVLALLAAITMMHLVHALPRTDLTARQGVNDLSNDSHIFHHLDRNQRTANRDRERILGGNAVGPGPHIARRLQDKSQHAVSWTMARERAVKKRFMQSPDYSESEVGDSGGGPNTASPASNATPTPPPPADEEQAEETANTRR